MSIAAVNSYLINTYQYAEKGGKTEGAGSVSFSDKLANTTQKKVVTSAVEDYKKRHPDEASVVDSYVNAGRKVLEKNNACNVDRDSMTMDAYKQFITGLMDRIPYDVSQSGDVNVWSITEDGWEQMKNDPDYEAWVLGYTATDRSVHNPWASMPGYSPCYHTEHFGASIDEHLGQGIPMKSSAAGDSDSDDEESWWEKRQKRLKEILEEQGKNAQLEKAAQCEQRVQEWEQQALASRRRMTEYLNGQTMFANYAMGVEVSSQAAATAMMAYGKSIITMDV